MNSGSQRNNFSTLDGIILSNFTTYAKLDPMILEAYADCNATEVNVFIDLYPIIKSCYKYTGDIMDETCLASNVISMCIHYKEFFRRKGVYAYFYIINSINCPQDNSIAVPGYNDQTIQLVNSRNNEKFILNNLKILKDISPYLPDMHFISSPSYESSIIISAIIKNLIQYNRPNMIISKDIYPAGLIGWYPNTSLLIPKKVRDNGTLIDDSFLLTSSISFWDWFIKKREIKFSELVKISSKYFSLINALTRFPERNMKSLFSLTKTLKTFNRLVEYGEIPAMDPPEIAYLKLILERVFPNINTTTVQLRYNALSTVHGALNSYENSNEFKFLRFDNQYNADVLKNYNGVLFAKNPIEIDKL